MLQIMCRRFGSRRFVVAVLTGYCFVTPHTLAATSATKLYEEHIPPATV